MTRSSAEQMASPTDGGRDGHRLAISASLLAMGVLLSVIESLYLPPLPVPGAKLGLANVVTLLLLAYLRPSDALLNVVMRVLIASLLTGGFMGTGMLFSAASSLSSFAVMYAAYRFGGGLLSFIGISVLGATASNIAQSAVGVWLLGTIGILVQLPLLLIVAVIGGTVTGALANAVIRRPEIAEALGATERVIPDAGRG